MELTRRAMLGALGGLAVGGTVASVVGTSIAADPKMKRFDQANGDFGWKPHKLDPNVCAPVAYEGYWHKGYACGYGTFYGIVGMMGDDNVIHLFLFFQFPKPGVTEFAGCHFYTKSVFAGILQGIEFFDAVSDAVTITETFDKLFVHVRFFTP